VACVVWPHDASPPAARWVKNEGLGDQEDDAICQHIERVYPDARAALDEADGETSRDLSEFSDTELFVIIFGRRLT